MTTFSPGDRVLYRDGDRFLVAKIYLVRDRHLTGFPFDPTRRSWSRVNRRIARDFVIERLPASTNTQALARRIEVLRNQHEAQRQQARRAFEEQVRALARQEDA
jgi:hypothetical protein